MPPALAAEAAVYLLLFARVGSMIMLMPMLGDDSVPRQVRVLLALGLTFALSGMLKPSVAPLVGGSEARLLMLLLSETVIGLALGMLARLFFQAAVIAGAIVSLQVGLTTALIFDPAMGGQTPLLAKLVGLGAALFCFSLGLHGWWFEALVRSYASFAPGARLAAGDWAAMAVSTASQATALAVSLAAPFLLFGILFNLALGIAGRLAPTIQIFFIAQPLMIAGGIALLAVTVPAMLVGFGDAYRDWLGGAWASG